MPSNLVKKLDIRSVKKVKVNFHTIEFLAIILISAVISTWISLTNAVVLPLDPHSEIQSADSNIKYAGTPVDSSVTPESDDAEAPIDISKSQEGSDTESLVEMLMSPDDDDAETPIETSVPRKDGGTESISEVSIEEDGEPVSTTLGSASGSAELTEKPKKTHKKHKGRKISSSAVRSSSINTQPKVTQPSKNDTSYDLIQFAYIILNIYGISGKKFMDYGNYCGYNGTSKGGRDGKRHPVDECDKCCQVHDNCYASVGKGCSPYTTGYSYEFVRQAVHCKDAKFSCPYNVCSCDEKFAECLRRVDVVQDLC